jgi:hypothetical protein
LLKLLMSALDGDGQGTDNALFNGIGACGARRGARRTSRRSQRKQQIEEHVTWVSSGSARRRSATGSRPTPEAASPRWRARQGRRLRTPVESRPLPEAASTRRWSSTGAYSTGHAAGRSPGHGAGRPACRSLDRGDLDGDGDAARSGRTWWWACSAGVKDQ